MEPSRGLASFDHELGRIESLLLEMGGVVEVQIAEAARALVTRDAELGEQVRDNDSRVDEMEIEIDGLAVNLLSEHQPAAQDLRRVVSTLKVSASLERIGDYAKNVAKRTTVVAKEQPVGSAAATIRRMAKLTQGMLHEVLDAYVARDIATADEIRNRDEQVDQLHNALFRELLTVMMEDPRNITACMHLLFIAKNVERIGDHVTGMAEQIHYLVSGEVPSAERPKGDVTSYISVDAADVAEGR